jgi:hypothetical protein
MYVKLIAVMHHSLLHIVLQLRMRLFVISDICLGKVLANTRSQTLRVPRNELRRIAMASQNSGMIGNIRSEAAITLPIRNEFTHVVAVRLRSVLGLHAYGATKCVSTTRRRWR